jgi:MFS transporter, FHS family, L-fucose permease
MNKMNSYRWPFILVTSLFFLRGFVHNLDPILIPHLRKAFQLTTLRSSLVDSSVFIAYFLMALPAGMIMKRYGYKTGIIIGLFLFALGSFLFVPAANTQQYIFFLEALFIIACGLGGALLPPVLGYIADVTHNIQNRYIIPLLSFIVILFFGLTGHKKKLRYE